MATETVKRCDVFRVFDAETYEIAILRIVGDKKVPEFSTKADLCERAYDRLHGFLVKGTTPPKPRKKGGADAAADAT